MVGRVRVDGEKIKCAICVHRIDRTIDFVQVEFTVYLGIIKSDISIHTVGKKRKAIQTSSPVDRRGVGNKALPLFERLTKDQCISRVFERLPHYRVSLIKQHQVARLGDVDADDSPAGGVGGPNRGTVGITKDQLAVRIEIQEGVRLHEAVAVG